MIPLVLLFLPELTVFYTILTAVNIKGVFNTSNETKYEKEAPDCNSAKSDYQFLSFIWSYNFHVQIALLFKSVYFICLLSGSSIDFNFYKTFWSLQVSRSEGAYWQNISILLWFVTILEVNVSLIIIYLWYEEKMIF